MSCALPLVHLVKNSPGVAGFVPVWEEHCVTQVLRQFQSSLIPFAVKSRVCPISVKIFIFRVQDLQ